jgi:hypothetical protein
MSIHTDEQNFIFDRQGTSQKDRFPKSLLDNSKILDSQGIDENLVFIYLYSDLLQYYDSENNKVEDNVWSKFLDNDDSVIISLISYTNFKKLKAEVDKCFIALNRKKEIDYKDKYLEVIFQAINELLVLINYWYKNLSQQHKIKLKLENLISRDLGSIVAELYDLVKKLPRDDISSEINKFCELIEKLRKESFLWNSISSKSVSDGISWSETTPYIYHLLNYTFGIIITQCSHLQSEAKSLFSASLTSQNHSPHMALLIAFLQLMEYAKDQLNTIPTRTLEFSYKEILKFREKPSTPDNIYINFCLDKRAKPVLIPKGTKINAGKNDKNTEIFFLTKEDITIGHSKLNTCYFIESFTRNNLSQPILPSSGIMSRAYSTIDLNNGMPLNLQLAKHTHKIGLIIASNSLNLPSGNRAILISLMLSEHSFSLLKKHTVIRKNEDSQEEMEEIVHKAIILEMSTLNGWYTVPRNNKSIFLSKHTKNSVDIMLNLPKDAPSILHNEKYNYLDGYPLKLPSMRLLIDSHTDVELFYSFSKIEIEKVSIEANVTNYRDSLVHSDLGILDTNKPFFPFGTKPQLGNSIYVDIKEIIYNNPRKIALNIEWANLPDLEGGFQSYYSAYPSKINNNSFLVCLSFLNGDEWMPIPAADRQIIPLFESENDINTGIVRLSKNPRRFTVDIDKFNMSNQKRDFINKRDTSLNGYLRLELCGPHMAFGHDEYPEIMKKTMLHNLNKHKKSILSDPNKPYTPFIKSLSLDYALRSEMIFNSNTILTNNSHNAVQNTVIRLSIFGYEEMYPSEYIKPFSILSTEEGENNSSSVCLGISDIDTNIISIHIQIDEDSVSENADLYPPKWQFLMKNRWVNFGCQSILKDGTNGLIKSGIVKLSLPDNINSNNTVMPNGLTWIRLCTTHSESGSLPVISGIYINAVESNRLVDETTIKGNNLSTIMPQSAKSIVGLQLHGIQNINQPFPSFGARVAETEDKFYSRVRERLRHKNRSSSVWDYERIVLEKFPEIAIAKCINHTSKSSLSTLAPGSITILVVPQITKPTSKTPPIASKYLLHTIKEYLKEIASPFVNIEVVNPTYDELKVIVELKIRKDYEQGASIEMLQNDLFELLSPWSLYQSNELKFNNNIYPSDIFEFIMKKEYVDIITKFSLVKEAKHAKTSSLIKINSYNSYIAATYPWSIIISAPSHIISINTDKLSSTETVSANDGVAGMSINKDFIVGPWSYGNRIAINKDIREKYLQESLESHYLVANVT